MGGADNKGEALLRDVHCSTDKVVKEELALCSFFIQQNRAESAHLWHRKCSGQSVDSQEGAILV